MFTEREQSRAIMEQRMREAAHDALVRQARTPATTTGSGPKGTNDGGLPQFITRVLRPHPAA